MTAEVAQWDWPKVLDAEFQYRFAIVIETKEVKPLVFNTSIVGGGTPTRRQMEFINGFMTAVMAQQVRGLRS